MIAIGFSTARRNPFSWIIRRLTGSKASHAWLLVDVAPFPDPMVFEATEVGVRLMPYKAFARRYRIVALFEPGAPLDEGLVRAGRWLGERYDFPGLLGMAVVLLGRWLGRKWKNPFNAGRALFCSELVTRVLRDARYPGAEALVPSRTSPQDLFDFLTRSTLARPTEPALPAPAAPARQAV